MKERHHHSGSRPRQAGCRDRSFCRPAIPQRSEKGLQKDKASGREKAVAAACNAVGGKLDSFYYAYM
jgi:hypothetical protein